MSKSDAVPQAFVPARSPPGGRLARAMPTNGVPATLLAASDQVGVAVEAGTASRAPGLSTDNITPTQSVLGRDAAHQRLGTFVIVRSVSTSFCR